MPNIHTHWFWVMAGKQLRLNICTKLKVSAIIKLLCQKYPTAVIRYPLPAVFVCHPKQHTTKIQVLMALPTLPTLFLGTLTKAHKAGTGKPRKKSNMPTHFLHAQQMEI